MTAFICLCTGAFWLSTHINLNLYLTLHRVAFLRNHPLVPDQNGRLPWEAFLEFQTALFQFAVTVLLRFHCQQGEELMIHLLPVTFWITGLWCTRATPRGRLHLLVLSQFGLNIYSLLLGLHAWTPEGSKTFIASPAPVFAAFTQPHPFLLHHMGDSPPGWGRPSSSRVSAVESVWFHQDKKMDSDSDSPFNYSWPSFPKMKIRRRASKQGSSWDCLLLLEPRQASSSSYLSFPHCFAELFLMKCMFVRVFVKLSQYKCFTVDLWGKPAHSSCVAFTLNLPLCCNVHVLCP